MKSRGVVAISSLVLLLGLARCGGGGSTQSTPPPPTPPPPANSSTFLYVSNSGSNNVSGYQLDKETGALTPVAGSPFQTPSNPTVLTANSDASMLVVANAGSQICVYKIDRKSGTLSPVPGSPFTGHGQPNALAIDPDDHIVLVGNRGTNDLSAFNYDPSTGVLTAIPGSPWPSAVGGINSLVYFKLLGTHPSLDVAGDTGIAECIPSDCSSAKVGYVKPTGSMVHSDGHTLNPALGSPGYLVYAIVQPGITGFDQSAPIDNFFDVPTTGSPFLAGDSPSSLFATPGFLFVSNSTSNNVTVFAITSVDGAVALMGNFAAGAGPADLNLDASGKFLFVANKLSNNVAVFKVDPGTGALAPVSGSPFPTGMVPLHVASTTFESSTAASP